MLSTSGRQEDKFDENGLDFNDHGLFSLFAFASANTTHQDVRFSSRGSAALSCPRADCTGQHDKLQFHKHTRDGQTDPRTFISNDGVFVAVVLCHSDLILKLVILCGKLRDNDFSCSRRIS